MDVARNELDHVETLDAKGYEVSCEGCGHLYRKEPIDGCEYCDSTIFIPTRTVIRQLEKNLVQAA